MLITGPPDGPVLFCSLVLVVCRLSASFVVVCNAAGGLAGPWAVGCRQARRVGGRVADTARRASAVTSR